MAVSPGDSLRHDAGTGVQPPPAAQIAALPDAGELDTGFDAGTSLPQDAQFLEEMDQLGLLSDFTEELPPEFTAVYEIARILADEDSDLFRELQCAMRLADVDGVEDGGDEEPDVDLIQLPGGEQYIADFIRSWSDLPYIYSWQWLLPEDVLLRRLASRTLWYPAAKTPQLYALDEGGDTFNPTGAKQKVYVLLDTSSSMAAHHRFALAKAVVLAFLDRNARELGQVFLRTFDTDLGPLHQALTQDEFDKLRRLVARQNVLGNGTCMEKAILRACEDIREEGSVTGGAEILMITDGAAHVRIRRVREALGDTIRIHGVKIGGSQVYASETYLADALRFANSGDNELDRRINRINEWRGKLKEGLRDARRDAMKRMIRSQISDTESLRRNVREELIEVYGHEIEELADVYVLVPDLDAEAVFRIGTERLASLRWLVTGVVDELERRPTAPESLKRAALLIAHISFLDDVQGKEDDATGQSDLAKLREELEQDFERCLADNEERILEGALMTRADRKDVAALLQRGLARRIPLWMVLKLRLRAAWRRLTYRRRR